jgi:hypothetical protein
MSSLPFILRGSSVCQRWSCSPPPPSGTRKRIDNGDGLPMALSCSSAIFSLAAGLAIILGHNVWSGGTLPVIVTLVGWLIFAKGLVLLVVTPETLALLRFWTARYAVLVTGPSATAGIEGVLIHGAQGVRSLTVALGAP